MDVLIAKYDENRIGWFENSGSDDNWSFWSITTSANQAISVYAMDLDGDGDMDVVSASQDDNKIAWYENNGGREDFTAHTVDTNAQDAKSVYGMDMDNDGDIDLLSASASDDKIAWYENDGAPDPSFTAHTITTNADGAYSVYSIDVDSCLLYTSPRPRD